MSTDVHTPAAPRQRGSDVESLATTIPSPSPAPTPNPVRVVGGLLVREGRVLLGRRSAYKRMAPNCWDMLGGHVESGEGLEQALLRELQEEAGILVTGYRPLAAGIALPGAHLTVYRVDAWTGEPSLRNDEHVALAWYRFDEALALPDLADPSLRWLIQRLR